MVIECVEEGSISQESFTSPFTEETLWPQKETVLPIFLVERGYREGHEMWWDSLCQKYKNKGRNERYSAPCNYFYFSVLKG